MEFSTVSAKKTKPDGDDSEDVAKPAETDVEEVSPIKDASDAALADDLAADAPTNSDIETGDLTDNKTPSDGDDSENADSTDDGSETSSQDEALTEGDEVVATDGTKVSDELTEHESDDIIASETEADASLDSEPGTPDPSDAGEADHTFGSEAEEGSHTNTSEDDASLETHVDQVATDDVSNDIAPPIETETRQSSETTEPSATKTPVSDPDRVVERVVERRSVFFPAVLGGLVAAAIGYVAGNSGLLDAYLPGSAQTEAQSEIVAELRVQIAALEERLNAQPGEPDLSGITETLLAEIATQTERLDLADSSLSSRVEDLQSQITEIGQLSIESGASQEAIAAYERELAAVQDALAQQRSEVENMIAEAAQIEAEASASAQFAQAQAAATRLFAALDTSAPFQAEVTELQSLGVTVPEALATSAEGLTSLGSLQADYPGVARSALSAARAEDGGSTGIGGFLQRQLGARSVTPRDGDDPDAVLSRAESALTGGDLDTALAELATLPDVSQAIFADWLAAAAARRDALNAANDLAQSLASN